MKQFKVLSKPKQLYLGVHWQMAEIKISNLDTGRDAQSLDSKNLLTDLNGKETNKIKGGLTRNTNTAYLGTLLS